MNSGRVAEKLVVLPVVRRVLEVRNNVNGLAIKLQVDDEYEANQ